MLTCQQATQLLSEKLDRKLKVNEITALNFHIMICTSCRRFGNQIKILSQTSKLYTQQNTPQEKGSEHKNNDELDE